jgi:hypothetical protein
MKGRPMGFPILTLILLAAGLAAPSQGRSADSVITGKAYVFSVKTPDGWVTDSSLTLLWYRADVVFIPRSRQRGQHAPIATIRAVPRVNADAGRDFADDMGKYRKIYPCVVFTVFELGNPRYRVHRRLYELKRVHYRYTAFIDPGKQCRHLLVARLDKDDAPATTSELTGFRRIVESLEYLGDIPAKSGHSGSDGSPAGPKSGQKLPGRDR